MMGPVPAVAVAWVLLAVAAAWALFAESLQQSPSLIMLLRASAPEDSAVGLTSQRMYSADRIHSTDLPRQALTTAVAMVAMVAMMAMMAMDSL
jgi:hypothetical protein